MNNLQCIVCLSVSQSVSQSVSKFTKKLLFFEKTDVQKIIIIKLFTLNWSAPINSLWLDVQFMWRDHLWRQVQNWNIDDISLYSMKY